LFYQIELEIKQRAQGLSNVWDSSYRRQDCK
jgi:hypothetical protein